MYFTLLQIVFEKFGFLVDFLSANYNYNDGRSSALAIGLKLKPSLGCYFEILGYVLVDFNMNEYFE